MEEDWEIGLEETQPSPLVLPKSSKSTTIGSTNGLELNQSFMTADGSVEAAGDNLESLRSLLESVESDSEQKISIDGLGDVNVSQNGAVALSLQTDEEKKESNPLSVQVINQDTFASEVSNDSCPFSQFHHQTSSYEFLRLPQIVANDEQRVFFGSDDFSSNVDHQVKFIVENLNSSGIWPMMFLEKLNRTIVHGDINIVRSIFQEDEFSILFKLVDLYRKEKKCPVIFRYWCTFYIILSKNHVPFPRIVDTGLIDILRRDFLRAAEVHLYNMDSKPCCSCREAYDEEHQKFSCKMQMEIISVLMIPLFTAKAALEPIHGDLTNEGEFVSLVLKIISESPSKQTKDSDDCLEAGEQILVNMLLAYNLQFSSHENPLVEAIVSMEIDHLHFKERLKKIFQIECEFLTKGFLDGIGCLLPLRAPYGVQLRGVNGPMKLLIEILSLDEFFFFDANEIKFLLGLVHKILSELAENGYWDDRTEEIKSNSLELKKLLKYKWRNFLSEMDRDITSSDSVVNSSTLAVSPKSSCKSDRSVSTNQSIADEKTSKASSNESDQKGRLMTSKMIQMPVDVLLKCFGCSKRAKSVVPVSSEKIRMYADGHLENVE